MKKLITLFAILAFASCKKEDMTFMGEPVGSISNECNKLTKLTNWHFETKTGKLWHTAGLETMALSGSISGLLAEYCDVSNAKPGESLQSQYGKDHPSDHERVTFASTFEYDGYWGAMYHPTSKYPDNFLMVDIDSGNWYRYDLSYIQEGTIVVQGRPVGETAWGLGQ